MGDMNFANAIGQRGKLSVEGSSLCLFVYTAQEDAT